jgi:hypothetical protein
MPLDTFASSFAVIRRWRGSTPRGLEELFFQLLKAGAPAVARLLRTGNLDGGVEWCATLPDGTESGSGATPSMLTQTWREPLSGHVLTGCETEADRACLIDPRAAESWNSESTFGQSSSPFGPSQEPSRLIKMVVATVREWSAESEGLTPALLELAIQSACRFPAASRRPAGCPRCVGQSLYFFT